MYIKSVACWKALQLPTEKTFFFSSFVFSNVNYWKEALHRSYPLIKRASTVQWGADDICSGGEWATRSCFLSVLLTQLCNRILFKREAARGTNGHDWRLQGPWWSIQYLTNNDFAVHEVAHLNWFYLCNQTNNNMSEEGMYVIQTYSNPLIPSTRAVSNGIKCISPNP